ncbi:MAG TPA: ATP-binding cassette domain-containing protein [Actinocrinis sp.]|uniref:ATP-binding cassette domain-containing protein n=1 Tax=Actinocrinis sp. TaxID=1920516 RepID=UPI002DDC91FB|nr:ATP-binding cassette domain-containing protein [Actinocrinis sp.]HEV3169384.1 ATP-binding cassette domain-containing protein [Actinocrinis sp.]
MTTALRCQGVRVRYGGVEVLHGVDLVVPYGALTALVGPNGAGKTTLLEWCGGVPSTATREEGRLELSGPDGRSADSRALRVVPSGVNVFPNLTVTDNLRATGRPDRAFELFPELAALAEHQAATLSGGERQLLAVAGGLTGKWQVLLVDEPVQGLAAELAERVYQQLAAFVSPDRAVLVAEPAAERALAVCDFVWQLDRGRITFAGEPSELFRERTRSPAR